ncbi:MAG: phosphatase PAP2 family protein [Lachnospiraceae bacterium]|nr:phosphatase PAP2 family protein [Lachnospiraceae bacterium]
MGGNIFYFNWEPQLMVWLQLVLGDFGTKVASLVSAFGEEMLMVGIMGFIYWCIDKRWGLYLGINLTASVTWNPMIKNIALRPRPYMVHSEVKCLKPVDKSGDIMDPLVQGWSFPSGHSCNAATVYGSLAYYKRAKALIAIAVIIPLLVGISRFALGVHYPTDVLAGWALGFASVLLVSWMQKAIKKDWVLYLILLATAIPGLFYCTSTDFYSSLGMMIGTYIGAFVEKRWIRFENTRSVPRMIIRTFIGIGLFFGLNTVLKMPFNKDFLASGTFASLMVRTARYAVILFVEVALYPACFKFFKKKA